MIKINKITSRLILKRESFFKKLQISNKNKILNLLIINSLILIKIKFFLKGEHNK
jgi:hypothetical protein